MRKSIIFIFACILIVSSCKKNKDNDPTPDPSADLNTYLSQLKPVLAATPVSTKEEVGKPIVSSTGTMYCKSTKYKLGPAYSEGFLLSPTNDIIYPGAILDGNSIYDGSYKLISLPRTGGIISTDNVGATVASKTIDETVKSKVQQGVIDILNEKLSGSAGAQINFEIKDIYSSQQVDMELGFTVGIAEKVKIKAGFDFSKSSVKSRILVKFQQIYYTMTYDAKQRPADYFQPGVTGQQVYNSINGAPITPVYVSNVKYGRMAFYSFESEMSQKDLRATLNAQLTTAKVSAEIDASYSTQMKNSNTTIKGTIIGGSGNDAVQAVNGVDDFYSYITKGGEYTVGSPGLPIAFTLRNITDNAVFNVVNISEYTVNECYNTTGAIKLNSAKHISGGQDDYIFGTVKANLGYDNQAVPFANAATVLYSNGNTMGLPTNGAEVQFSPSNPFNLVYDATKFNDAYILVSLDITNRHSWSGIGKDNHSGNTDDNLKQDYKIYLKDIIENKLGANWSVNNTQSDVTFDLNVAMDGQYAIDNACTAKVLGSCTKRENFDVSKSSSNMYFNFSINVTQE